MLSLRYVNNSIGVQAVAAKTKTAVSMSISVTLTTLSMDSATLQDKDSQC